MEVGGCRWWFLSKYGMSGFRHIGWLVTPTEMPHHPETESTHPNPPSTAFAESQLLPELVKSYIYDYGQPEICRYHCLFRLPSLVHGFGWENAITSKVFSTNSLCPKSSNINDLQVAIQRSQRPRDAFSCHLVPFHPYSIKSPFC